MEKIAAIALGWLASNAAALVAGGYLGYRFGHYVEAVVSRVLGVIKKA